MTSHQAVLPFIAILMLSGIASPAAANDVVETRTFSSSPDLERLERPGASQSMVGSDWVHRPRMVAGLPGGWFEAGASPSKASNSTGIDSQATLLAA